YVHFEFYITAYDEASKVLWDALFAAQKRGVRVRVLIDHIGSRKYPSYRQLTKMLNESGIEWRLMLPIKPWRLQWQRPD
ncbi:phospholipase D-like domain-containing protein, partial [Pseudomonas sp. 5B4]|nr:phospholipase D-like domain-containing protein [Pseudomonas sp. 5B4]